MENEELKKAIYDKLSSRRKKFIDKIGYENWDPFQEPNNPIDIRTDVTKRTAQELINEFFRYCSKTNKNINSSYKQGVYECCMGIFRADEKYKGIYDFCLWYMTQLQDQGISPEKVWER